MSSGCSICGLVSSMQLAPSTPQTLCSTSPSPPCVTITLDTWLLSVSADALLTCHLLGDLSLETKLSLAIGIIRLATKCLEIARSRPSITAQQQQQQRAAVSSTCCTTEIGQAVPDGPSVSVVPVRMAPSFRPTLPGEGRQQLAEVQARSQACTQMELERLQRSPKFIAWQAQRCRARRTACVWHTCMSWSLRVLFGVQLGSWPRVQHLQTR